MKPLYYAATARGNVAPALATQVHESLRPYLGYLKSSLDAARKREARSHCPWAPVPRSYTVRLTPRDSQVVLERSAMRYRVAGWTEPVPPMPLFVGEDFRPVQPTAAESHAEGAVVTLPESIPPDSPVYWSGKQCRLEPVGGWPDRLMPKREDGRIAAIVRRREVGDALWLVVEGTGPVVVESEHGAVQPHRVERPEARASRLRIDGADHEWDGQRELRLSTLPSGDTLLADNGVRWAWASEGGRHRSGVWVQLLDPGDEDSDSDAVVDPRAAYCEDGVREVRTRKDGGSRFGFKVYGVRRDDYQLELDRLPPDGSSLFIPASTGGLSRQRHAIFQLKDSPLPHHRGLLRLCEHPGKVRWPAARREAVDHWFLLDDPRYSGTEQQRAFVEKALGTPDFAFLEGPPGSGKTHAICELVLQFIARGQRVLLCSTTHVAVDNVLERLLADHPQVEAVRIGRVDRVDEAVRAVQIDERTAALAEAWRAQGVMPSLDEGALAREAEAIVLGSVNLTCGTSTGILAHPYIRHAGRREDARRTGPAFDVLIVDEASKTTLQEFLVPAALAARWVIVGDVRQLPPFTDPKDLEASIAEVEEAGQTLPAARQRALLLLFRLGRRDTGAGRVRWILEEPDAVLDALTDEIEARRAKGEPIPSFVRITATRAASPAVAMGAIERGRPEALRLLAVDWILFPPTLRSRVEPYLPPDALTLADWPADSLRAHRFAHWHARWGAFHRPVREGRQSHETASALAERQRRFLVEETWSGQVAWRIGRVHQLGAVRDPGQRERRQKEVDALMAAAAPFADWVPGAIEAIRDVGVRSVIEALRIRRVDHGVRRESALTEALPDDVWDARAVLLEYQHRMHPDISALPRAQFYDGSALRDANTLDVRAQRIPWGFMPDLPTRRVWVDVQGRESRGINEGEVAAMRRWLDRWRAFAADNPRPDGQRWQVACLSFYARQERGIRDMLRTLTGKAHGQTRFSLPETDVVCATVDRFQGREADMVLLSMRNTARTGHMDSPNRLNVGITRARFLLAIFGHRTYFQRCLSEDLVALAEASPPVSAGGHR